MQAMLTTAEALYRAGKLADAEAVYRDVLTVEPTNFTALNNLASVLKDRDQYAEAVEYYLRAAMLRPTAGTFANLLYIFSDQRRDDDAARCYRQAIQLEPDNVLAHYNAALWRLRNGDFENGLPGYEWRFKTGGYVTQDIPRPRWGGQSLRDKTILIWSDQGAGDCIQFVRFVESLKRLGARTVLAVPARLQPLMAMARGIDRLVGEDAPTDFDYHSPLVSLAAALDVREATIPRGVPYFNPDKSGVTHWRERLGDGFKIGIAWQGNRNYRHDARRSIALRHFAFLSMPGVRLISLQMGEADQLASAWFNVDVLDGVDRRPFVDTAAIIRCLDLVVTSDTSIAHLAGALGVPTFVALDSMPEWRWQWDRVDSPWYPTARLFRQKTAGDWPGVFADIAAAIKERFGL